MLLFYPKLINTILSVIKYIIFSFYTFCFIIGCSTNSNDKRSNEESFIRSNEEQGKLIAVVVDSIQNSKNKPKLKNLFPQIKAFGILVF